MAGLNEILFQRAYQKFRQATMDTFELTLHEYQQCGLDQEEATMTIMTDLQKLVIATLRAYFEMPKQVYEELCSDLWDQHQPENGDSSANQPN